MMSMAERYLWLRSDIRSWWHRHGFTIIRWSKLAKTRQNLHLHRLIRRAARRRITELESLVAADEATIRRVGNDLAKGDIYSATLRVETALKTHTE